MVKEQNSFTVRRYGTSIMSRKGNGTFNLRHPKKESGTLIWDRGLCFGLHEVKDNVLVIVIYT